MACGEPKSRRSRRCLLKAGAATVELGCTVQSCPVESNPITMQQIRLIWDHYLLLKGIVVKLFCQIACGVVGKQLTKCGGELCCRRDRAATAC